MLADQGTAFVDAQFHDGTEEIRLGNNLRTDIRFFNMVDEGGRRQAGRIVDIQDGSLGGIDLIGDIRHRGNHVHVEFAEQAFLDDFQVQQAQETAAETEAQGQRAFGFIHEGGVVQLEFFQDGTQFLELGCIHRVHAREHHRLDLFESGDGRTARAVGVGDGIAHLNLHGAFDARYDIADIAAGDLAGGVQLEFQGAHLFGIVLHAGVEEFHLVARPHRAVHDLEIGDDAAEGVENRVENQRLQGSVRISLRRGNLVHDGVQDGRHALARAGRYLEDLFRRAAQQVAHLIRHHLHLRAFHVDLVQDGNDFQPVIDGQIKVGNGLGLNALRCIHHQQGTLARSNRPGYLIRKIHVSGGIDEIQEVFLPVAGIFHLNRMALDGDALLLLQVHVVQNLVFHVALRKGSRQFQKPVGQRAFTVVDMCDDTEVSDSFHECKNSEIINYLLHL